MKKRIFSKEHRKKISIAMMGNRNGQRKRRDDEKKAISIGRLKRKALLGYLNSPETRKKMSLAKKGLPPWNKGKKYSLETRKKISLANLKRFANPENHPRWLHGKSFEPYTKAFTKQLKLKVKQRDYFTCQSCEVKEKDYFQKLSIHHIDYNKVNCKENNLITLCRSCNAKVNARREYWCQFFKLKVQRLKTEHPKG